ncbi:hypothetical protein Leryth_022473 [Lithospermum erythrorhizon]|nr:hypothetical protein Leryth_022473 [Lithospermum erythrorhizon]
MSGFEFSQLCCIVFHDKYIEWLAVVSPGWDEPLLTKEVEEWKEYRHSVHWNRWDQEQQAAFRK